MNNLISILFVRQQEDTWVFFGMRYLFQCRKQYYKKCIQLVICQWVGEEVEGGVSGSGCYISVCDCDCGCDCDCDYGYGCYYDCDYDCDCDCVVEWLEGGEIAYSGQVLVGGGATIVQSGYHARVFCMIILSPCIHEYNVIV